MKKIEFLKDVANSIWGRSAQVHSTDCGQLYTVTYEGPRGGTRMLELWIDSIKNGRISLKIKCLDPVAALRYAKALWNAVYYSDRNYVLDAKAKADVYSAFSPRGNACYYVARLRMDKVWR